MTGIIPSGTLWYGTKVDTNDPCPTGWQLPAIETWRQIISGSAQQISPVNAATNKWVWANGYKIQPDGQTTSLYLPAGGNRDQNGTFSRVSERGYYWSSTATANEAWNFVFTSGSLAPADAFYRSTGRSVRCVKQ